MRKLLIMALVAFGLLLGTAPAPAQAAATGHAAKLAKAGKLKKKHGKKHHKKGKAHKKAAKASKKTA